MLSSFARDSKDYWTPSTRSLQGQNEVSSLGSRTVPERRMDEKNCGKMERAKGFEPLIRIASIKLRFTAENRYGTTRLTRANVVTIVVTTIYPWPASSDILSHRSGWAVSPSRT